MRESASQFRDPEGGARRLIEEALLSRSSVDASTLEELVEKHPHLTESLRTEWQKLQRIDEVVAADAGRRTDKVTVPAGRRLRIDGYQVEERIGAGGQASVVRAIQQSTGQQVAIKAIYGGALSTDAARKRFEREVRILVELDHPHIVSVIDRGVTDEGTPFVVMRYIDGINLQDWLHPPDPEKTAGETRRHSGGDIKRMLTLFRKICHAVDAAHQKGIIHRDLKPDNILVDALGEPRVLDFGLARESIHAHVADPFPQTETGHFVGSLPWASPEQFGAIDASTSARSDVYSLGLILYDMVAGRLPFDSQASLRSLMDAVPQATSVAPSRWRASRNTQPALSSSMSYELDQIVLKAIHIDPSRRYPTAGDLAADVDAVLHGRPTLALQKIRAQQRSRLAIGGGVLLTTAILVMVWAMVTGRRPSPATSVAGSVWLDANRNGWRDPDEHELSGIRVFQDANGNGHWDSSADGQSPEPSSLTDSEGTFRLLTGSSGGVIRCQSERYPRSTFPRRRPRSNQYVYAWSEGPALRRLAWQPGQLPDPGRGIDFPLKDSGLGADYELVRELVRQPCQFFLLDDFDILACMTNPRDRQYMLRMRIEGTQLKTYPLITLPLDRVVSDIGDVNADGILDLLLLVRNGVPNKESNWSIQVALGTIEGLFDFDSPLQEFVQAKRRSRVALAHVNSDPFADLLVSCQDSGGYSTFHLQWLPGNGDGTFDTDEPKSLLFGPENHGLILQTPCDVTGDEKADLVLTPDDDTQNEGLSYVAVNQGSGEFQLQPFVDLEPDLNEAGQDRSAADNPIVADVDLDGNLDLLIYSTANPRFRLYRDVAGWLGGTGGRNRGPVEAVAERLFQVAWPRRFATGDEWAEGHSSALRPDGAVVQLHFGLSNSPDDPR